MNILFLGYAIPKEEAAGLYGASVAGNKMQINILKELNKYSDMNLKCLTLYPVAAFPNGVLYVKKEKIRLFPEFWSVKVSFWNLSVVKQILQPISVFIAVRRMIKSWKTDVILTFNMFPELGIAACLMKKIYGVNIISILADLPIDDTADRKRLFAVLRKFYDKMTQSLIRNCCKLIVLNSYAAELFAPGMDYIVVEGGVDPDDVHEPVLKDKTKKNIVFAGTLTNYSGVLPLMEAMQFLKHTDTVLHIYGLGQLASLVESSSEKVQNIVYHGKISHLELVHVMEEAYLLINPRPVDDLIAKVTFPSKIFEYMLSGTPVLTTRLNGLSEDYLSNVYCMEYDSPEKLGTCIGEVLDIPQKELERKAEGARKFILSRKKWEIQGERIYRYLMETKKD